MIRILRKIFSISVTAILIIGSLFLFIQSSKGYDDQTTHPGLTDEIVDFYNLSFDKKLTEEEKEWIVQGAIDEDTPPRWINHFYDPINKVGWSGENTGIWPTMLVQYFSANALSSHDPVNSLFWLHAQEYQAEYGQYKGNRTWERAIYEAVNGNKKEAYYTLGFILHLVEDATVPDHTRNDTHAHELRFMTGDYGSPYEEFSKQFTRSNLSIAKDLKKNGNEPIVRSSIDEYLVSLAEYSNKYFFSKDTISNEKYSKPDIKNIRDENGYGYGSDENNNEFPIANSEYDLILENRKWKKVVNYYLPKNDNNSIVLTNYFSRLSRHAVLNGAGVINLFEQEVAKAEKEKLHALPKENSSVFSITGRIFQAKNFVFDTLNTISNTLSSAYDSAKAAVSNIVTIEVTRPVGDFSKSQTASLLDAVSSEAVVMGPMLVSNTVQGESLDGVSSGVFTGTVTTPTPNTIQSQALDSKNQSIISQAPVFVGGAMPIVAVPAPVVASQSQTTPAVAQEEQPVVQDPLAEVPATTTPEIALDTTAPVITILGDNPTTVLVGGHYTELGATALDDVDGVRTVLASSSVSVFTEGDYLVSYTASDLSGNVAHATRTVSVIPTLATFSFSDVNNNGIADSDEADVLVDMNTALPSGEYRFNNLTIASSSTLTLQGDPLSLADFKGVKIVAQNITVDTGSSLSADYQGYDQVVSGPGVALARGGASYGGVGYGNTIASAYGSSIAPAELGSSGPSVCCSINKKAGGAVRLVVTGTLTNNGNISADGSSPSTSGGSIYVITNNLVGGGSFHANGGDGASYYYTGAGGGGRVAIYYQNSSYDGVVKAQGGFHSDGWGSLLRVGNGTTGLFDIKNNDLYISSSWRFSANEGPFNFNRIVVTDGASVVVEDGVNLSAHELSIAGTSTFSIAGSSVINIPIISVDDNSTLTFSGRESLTLDTLSATENSTISVAQGSPLSLHLRDLTISANSKISLDNKGYSGSTGPGAPIDFYDGASHGGVGYNNSATSTYGSITEPIEMGSGGNGHQTYAQGGGALKIIADGTFALDGAVSARGGITSSGGSIYIIAHRLTGSGQIVADGGPSYWQGQYIGPGGGGRIAVTAEQYAFVGSMSALGGCLSYDGWTLSCAGNGTIENSNVLEPVADEEVAVPEVQNETPVIQDITPPVITIGTYDGTTATSSPITITATTNEGILNAESHTFTENGSFDFVATDDAGNTATTTIAIENIDTTPPSITSYTLNDTAGNVEMPVASPSPITLVVIASENVDWVSLRIEHSEDASIYKTFYSGAECVDGTAVCTKVWDTSLPLSKGDFIEGTYRIKAHFRDMVGNDVTEYLAPYVVIVQGEPVQNEAPIPTLEVPEPVL